LAKGLRQSPPARAIPFKYDQARNKNYKVASQALSAIFNHQKESIRDRHAWKAFLASVGSGR